MFLELFLNRTYGLVGLWSYCGGSADVNGVVMTGCTVRPM